MHNLPRQLTSFVGRQAEISRVRLLLPSSRLLTLTGAGGCGKTRLALEVAAQVAGDYPDGVWLVELAPIGSLGLVAQQLAIVLGVHEEPGRPVLDSVVDWARERDLLLVLDNCEHVIEACAFIAERLLRECARLRALATSREALNIPGEVTLRVPSLGLPPSGAGATAEQLAASEAVALFVDRARAVQPGFALTAENAPAVAEITLRLDGIPLAIELAAAAVGLMTPELILDRLDDRFRLLTRGSRTALPRQRTLRAALDWSHDLLGPDEQRVFRRLAAFAGGFSLESAEAVAAGDGVAGADVLGLLSSLVDKSLVVAQPDGRYRLLESLRHYAADRLLESGESRATRDRHLDHFRRLAATAEPRPRGTVATAWLARFDLEHDNIRAALEWGVSRGGPEALRLAVAVTWYWNVRGLLSEGRQWLEQALAAFPGASPVHISALGAAGWLALRHGDYEVARATLEESLRLQRETGHRDLLPDVHNDLGLVAYFEGDARTAQRHFEQAYASATDTGDDYGMSTALFRLGLAAYFSGDHATARARAEESLATRRRHGDQVGTAFALGLLGNLDLDAGDLPGARATLEAGVAGIREVGDRVNASFGLEALARVCVAESRPARALTLAGAAASLRRLIGTPTLPQWEALLEPDLETARRVLGAEAATEAWAEGAAMTVEEAIAYALDASGPAGAVAAVGPLSPREWEIATLVAQGLTNREIAERLFIARRTAETHVQNVLNKLGLSSRAQIAVWVVEQRRHARSGEHARREGL